MPGDLRRDVGKRVARRGDRAEAVQQVLDRGRDQGRAEPGGAERGLGPDDLGTLARRVRSGLENESPQRPLIWMSQNAGATQSSGGSPLTVGPSTDRAAVKSPSF